MKKDTVKFQLMIGGIILILSVIVGECKAQIAKIIFKDDTDITTKINASSSTQLFTKDKSIDFNNIKKVIFKQNEERYQGVFDKLSAANIIYVFESGLVYEEEKINTELERLLKSKNADYPDNLPFDEDGNLVLSEVVEIEGVNAEQLYARSRLFFTEYFKSSNDVIQLDDPINRTIVGKGLSHEYIKFNSGFSGDIITDQYIHYTIKIQAKDGRYRYFIDNFYTTTLGSKYQGLPSSDLKNTVYESTFTKGNKGIKNSMRNTYLETVENYRNVLIRLRMYILTSMDKQIVDSDW